MDKINVERLQVILNGTENCSRLTRSSQSKFRLMRLLKGKKFEIHITKIRKFFVYIQYALHSVY